MTTQQKKTIEQQLFLASENHNDLWRLVFERTLIKCKFEITEAIIKLYFVEHKKVHTICRTLKISKSNFYYHLGNVENIAFAFARELNLL